MFHVCLLLLLLFFSGFSLYKLFALYLVSVLLKLDLLANGSAGSLCSSNGQYLRVISQSVECTCVCVRYCVNFGNGNSANKGESERNTHIDTESADTTQNGDRGRRNNLEQLPNVTYFAYLINLYHGQFLL